MAGGEWERLATEVVIPGLREAAAELNRRDGLAAEWVEDPSGDACLLWIARRLEPLSFLSPQGSLAIVDEPGLPMVRVEETASMVSGGRPVVAVYLRQSGLSARSVSEMALAFAERLLGTTSSAAAHKEELAPT
jgi:hypothetical protein